MPPIDEISKGPDQTVPLEYSYIMHYSQILLVAKKF